MGEVGVDRTVEWELKCVVVLCAIRNRCIREAGEQLIDVAYSLNGTKCVPVPATGPSMNWRT